VPMKWMQRVKQCMRSVSANYNSQRMVDDYRSQLYQPADRAWEAMTAHNFAPAREHTIWSERLRRCWAEIRFIDATAGPNTAVLAGVSLPLRARIDLAGLSPADVRVEALVGKIGPQGELEEAQVLSLGPIEQNGTAYVFGHGFSPLSTGRLGFSVRVTPNHYSDPLNRPCNAPLKWM
jgi:glycogen phosphorylase